MKQICFFLKCSTFTKRTVHVTKLGQAQCFKSLNELLQETHYIKRDLPLQLSIVQYTADMKQGN